jgi:hypothetical protein
MSVDWVELAIVVALITGFVAGVLNHSRVIRILRDRHPDTWKMLGAPTLIRNNSISNSRRLSAFLKAGEYKALGDPDLDATVRFNRILERSYLVVLLIFGLRFLATAIRS